MNSLIDLETKLAILSSNPCACTVCVKAARFAKHVLMDVSPSGQELMLTAEQIGTPKFTAAEQKFIADETARLQDAYDTISQVQCQMIPPPQPALAPIPDLPDANEFSDRIEQYRKHSMGPRMVHRRRRIEMQNNPRVPGSYWIK